MVGPAEGLGAGAAGAGGDVLLLGSGARTGAGDTLGGLLGAEAGGEEVLPVTLTANFCPPLQCPLKVQM